MNAIETTAERARAVLAGGCDSPVRSGWSIGEPMFVPRTAHGAYVFDERGRRFVDYVMAYGPLLFGHTHSALTTGLDELVRDGFVWGATHVEEVRLAERIRGYLPSMQRLRFVTTGSEAAMSAVRVARAFTKRDLVLKFAGNYHGHFDLALLDADHGLLVLNPSKSDIAALREYKRARLAESSKSENKRSDPPPSNSA